MLTTSVPLAEDFLDRAARLPLGFGVPPSPLGASMPLVSCSISNTTVREQFSKGPAEQRTLMNGEAWARMRRVNPSHLRIAVVQAVAQSLSRRYPFACWKEREVSP